MKGGDYPQNPKVFYLNIQYDQFVAVVELSAPFFLNSQSLMVRFVYICPIHNIGKELVILLRGCTG